jgi:CubicO group peptidase (beta-lactamase class C family)
VYHALSYGHLAGEILRRIDGRSIGGFIVEQIARPLGVEFFVGLPEAEDARAAEMIAGEGSLDTQMEAEHRPSARSGYLNPRVNPTQPNERAWRAAEIPGANGHGDELGLARIYGTLARGGVHAYSEPRRSSLPPRSAFAVARPPSTGRCASPPGSCSTKAACSERRRPRSDTLAGVVRAPSRIPKPA